MADITLTRGSSLPDSSAKSDFHGLVDNATAAISNIVNSDISNSAAIASSKLDLSAVGQNIVMSSKAINGAKGSDIASATTTDIGAATGNFVDVTGTTTITGLGTVQAGTIRFVRFTGILTLTHSGTALILPTTANVTTAAGDRAIFVSLGSGNWLCLAYQRADGTPLGSAFTPTASNALSGSVIQTVKTLATTYRSLGSTALVLDDSLPRWDEGNTHADLDTAFTANNASNIIRVTISFNVGYTGSAGFIYAAMYLDPSTGSDTATKVAGMYTNDGNCTTLNATWYVTAADTNAHTYKFRIGFPSSVAVYLNGNHSSRLFGGAFQSTVTIEEIKA